MTPATTINVVSASMIATAFTCFTELPIELQSMVWTFACHHERNVDMWNKPLKISNASIENPEDQWFEYATTTPPPAILHACHNAREVGLKHYDLTFDTEFNLGRLSIRSRPSTYVNFQTDCIFLMGEWNESQLYDVLSHPIQKIAFNADEMEFDLLLEFSKEVTELEEILLFDGPQKDIRSTTGIRYQEVDLHELAQSQWHDLATTVEYVEELCRSEGARQKEDSEDTDSEDSDFEGSVDLGDGPKWNTMIIKAICLGEKSMRRHRCPNCGEFHY